MIVSAKAMRISYQRTLPRPIAPPPTSSKVPVEILLSRLLRMSATAASFKFPTFNHLHENVLAMSSREDLYIHGPILVGSGARPSKPIVRPTLLCHSYYSCRTKHVAESV